MTKENRVLCGMAAVMIGLVAFVALQDTPVSKVSAPTRGESETAAPTLPPDFDREKYRAELRELLARDRNRAVEREVDPRVEKFREVAWVHELGAGWMLDAEAFGETLHVTVSAQFNRGWLALSCGDQRTFVSDLYTEWKARNSTAHTVALLNPGGREIGKYSKLWGYHCG